MRVPTRPTGRLDGLTVARVVAGVVFVLFGAAKFVNHASEAAAFDRYGLPAPDVFTVGVGTLELAGGLALVVGVGVLIAAVLLAGNMAGAIVVSGLVHGEWISLTLAPLLLAVMLMLVVHRVRPE